MKHLAQILATAVLLVGAGCGAALAPATSTSAEVSASTFERSPPPPNTTASLPPGYGAPIEMPSAEACRACSYRRVLLESAAGQDEVLLCTREPATPIKPLNRRGVLLRSSLVACDPLCCP
jgi:hypothetical protein